MNKIFENKSEDFDKGFRLGYIAHKLESCELITELIVPKEDKEDVERMFESFHYKFSVGNMDDHEQYFVYSAELDYEKITEGEN